MTLPPNLPVGLGAPLFTCSGHPSDAAPAGGHPTGTNLLVVDLTAVVRLDSWSGRGRCGLTVADGSGDSMQDTVDIVVDIVGDISEEPAMAGARTLPAEPTRLNRLDPVDGAFAIFKSLDVTDDGTDGVYDVSDRRDAFYNFGDSGNASKRETI